MKRYWDHLESERAKLTAEQIEKLLAYELMEKGVLQVEPLKLEEIQPIELPKRRVFALYEANGYGGQANLGIGFDSIEQAEAARDAIRYIRESPWNAVPHTRPARAIQIVTEELPTDEAVTAAKAALDEQKRRETANAEAKRLHEEACKKVAEATAAIWTDRAECERAEARRQRIRDTLTDYVRMTEGNEILARAFLAKAFPADEIGAALGEQIVAPPAPKPAAASAESLEF